MSGGGGNNNTGTSDGNVSPVPTLTDVQQFWSRYEATKATEQAKNTLVEDVVTHYDDLLRKHHQYIAAHQQERAEAQSSTEAWQYWNAQAMYLQSLLNENAYLIALIDGDSLVFNDDFLRQGENGGKQAATLMHNAILERFLPTLSDCPVNAKVLVRVFANVQALGDICAKNGLVLAPKQMEDFARGFSAGRVSCDFIDVGSGKNASASKIVDAFKLNIGDYHCRQVLLGCRTEQQPYLQLLEKYSNDTDALPRFTLIDGLQPHNGFGKVKIHKIPGMFLGPSMLGQPGRGRVDSRIGLSGASGIFTPSPSQTSSVTHSPLRNITNLQPNEISRNLSSASVPVPQGQTWAVVTNKNAHKPLTEAPRPPASPEALKLLQRNKHGQRIDAPIDSIREEVQRMKKLKACNQHYIGSGCCHYNAGKEAKCPHNHRYSLTAVDLKHLRVVARETPCKRGHDCDDLKCIYGHQCPFPLAMEGSLRGAGCMLGDMCRFPRSMHNMDVMPVKMIKISGAF